MNKLSSLWLSLSAAAEHLDCSKDTILRRAVPWEDAHVARMIRFKYLKLGQNTRMERRYYVPDLDELLVNQ
jgi:hypothetical protein